MAARSSSAPASAPSASTAPWRRPCRSWPTRPRRRGSRCPSSSCCRAIATGAERPDAEVARAVERLTGARVVAQRPVAGGYTYSANRVVTLEDGRTLFAKAAADDLTRAWLRLERRFYEQV